MTKGLPTHNAPGTDMAQSPNGSYMNGAASDANGGHSRQPSDATADSPASPDKLIVGVDFGTTYSGVAAAYSATPDEIDIIKTWPGGNGITSDKVPTEI
ncbi:hypothetical protein LTR53_018835, partial [Teratosphaeriaceae sp. CCFEE 6253]